MATATDDQSSSTTTSKDHTPSDSAASKNDALSHNNSNHTKAEAEAPLSDSTSSNNPASVLLTNAFNYIHNSLRTTSTLSAAVPTLPNISLTPLKQYATSLSDTITTATHHATQYIHEKAKKHQHLSSTPSTSAVTPLKQRIIWKSFETLFVGGARHTFLLCGLHDGFHIYAIYSDIDVRLVLSHTLGEQVAIGQLKFIQHGGIAANTQTTSKASSYHCVGCECEPLLAIISATDNDAFKRNTVKIFSIKKQQYIHTLTFQSHVHAIHTSNSVLAVSLENEIHVYKNPIHICASSAKPSKKSEVTKVEELNFELLRVIKCFNNVKHSSSVALSDRFIAYASAELINSNTNNNALNAQTHAMTHSHSPSSSPHQQSTIGNGTSPHMSPIMNGLMNGSKHSPSLPSNLSLRSTIPHSLSHPSNSPSPSPKAQPLVHSSHSPLPAIMSKDALLSQLPPSVESMGTAAKSMVSNLYNLGGYSKQKVSEYMNGELNHSSKASNGYTILQNSSTHTSNSIHQNSTGNNSAAGTVLIRDMFTNHVIASFRHFTAPILTIRFDNSGTLLAVATDDGQYVHIYRLYSPKDSKHGTKTDVASSHNKTHAVTHRNHHLRCIYRLFRGITHATIKSIGFSSDSKWVSLSSTSGTTHIYAINPDGGKVLYATHSDAKKHSAERNKQASVLGIDGDAECYTLNPRHRLKTSGASPGLDWQSHLSALAGAAIGSNNSADDSNTEGDAQDGGVESEMDKKGKVIPTCTPTICAWLPSAKSHIDYLLLVNDVDQYSTYHIEAKAKRTPSSSYGATPNNPHMNGTLTPTNDNMLNGISIVSCFRSPSSSPRNANGNSTHSHASGSPVNSARSVTPYTKSKARSCTGAETNALTATVNAAAKLDVDKTLQASFDLSDINNAHLIAQINQHQLSYPQTMLTSYFEELRAQRHKILAPTPQEGNELAVRMLQHASWLAQAELQTHNTSSSEFVPVYASPQFTLCTFESATDSNKPLSTDIQQVGGYRIQALKYDKYAAVAANQSNETELLQRISKFQNDVAINGMSVNEKLNEAISTSVSVSSRVTEEPFNDLSRSPSTFSPTSYTLDRDLASDHLEIGSNAANDMMISSGYTDQSATINCLDEYFTSQPKSQYNSPSYTFTKTIDSNALQSLAQQTNQL